MPVCNAQSQDPWSSSGVIRPQFLDELLFTLDRHPSEPVLI